MVVVWGLTVAIVSVCIAGLIISKNEVGRLRLNDVFPRENRNKTAVKKSPYQRALIIEFGPAEERQPIAIDEPPTSKEVLEQISIARVNGKGGLPGQNRTLQFVVSNKSNHPVKQVQIDIEYLRSNGKVFFSKTILIDDLMPATEFKLATPNCKPGHRIKYRVGNIYMPVQSSAHKIV